MVRDPEELEQGNREQKMELMVRVLNRFVYTGCNKIGWFRLINK